MGFSSRVVAALLAGSLAFSPAAGAWADPVAPKAGAKAPDAKPDAKPDLAAAKRHYAQGDKLFKAGDFAGALPEFQAANDIKSTPQVERFIGMCEDNLGHFHAALDWYAKFLDHVPEKLASQGDELRKRSAEIKAMPGKVHVDSTPAGATVSVDDKPAAAPTPTDLDVAPGSHVLKLTAAGRVATTKTIDVAFASSQTVTAELAAEPPAPPPPPPAAPVAVAAPAPAAEAAAGPQPPAEPRSKVPAFVTGGLAIAAAGVGAVFGVLALNDQTNFNKTPTTQTADNGDTHALICDMAFGVAITFGVTSAVLFLTRDDAPAAATASTSAPRPAHDPQGVSVAATPIVGPHTGGAGLAVRF